MTAPLPPICQPCQEASNRWLDYKLPRTVGIAYGSGAPYDVSAAGMRDRQRGRFEEWKATIKFNQDLITRTCREQRHTDTAAETVARVVQIPLFDLLEEQEAA